MKRTMLIGAAAFLAFTVTLAGAQPPSCFFIISLIAHWGVVMLSVQPTAQQRRAVVSGCLE